MPAYPLVIREQSTQRPDDELADVVEQPKGEDHNGKSPTPLTREPFSLALHLS